MNMINIFPVKFNSEYDALNLDDLEIDVQTVISNMQLTPAISFPSICPVFELFSMSIFFF